MDLAEVVTKLSGSGLDDASQMVTTINAAIAQLAANGTEIEGLTKERDTLRTHSNNLLGQKGRANTELKALRGQLAEIIGLAVEDAQDQAKQMEVLGQLKTRVQDIEEEKTKAIEERDTALKTLKDKVGELNLEKASQALGVSGVVLGRMTGLDPSRFSVENGQVSIKGEGDTSQPWAEFLAAQPADVQAVLGTKESPVPPTPKAGQTPRVATAPPNPSPKETRKTGGQILATAGFAVPKTGS